MPKNLSLFLNIGNGASYFLSQAFHHIDLAIEDDIRDHLFHEKLESLDVETEHISAVFKDGEVKNAVDLLQSDILKLIEDPEDPVVKAQGEAKEEAAQMRNVYSKNHKITSKEILGHLNNFAFFVEAMINRHLLFLSVSNEIHSCYYNKLKDAAVVGKLLFVTKNAFQEQTDTIEAVSRLFRLRNRTAHYTPENAESLKVTINELFTMWGHTGKLLAYFHSLEQFTNDDFEGMLRKHIKSFEEKWVKTSKRLSE